MVMELRALIVRAVVRCVVDAQTFQILDIQLRLDNRRGCEFAGGSRGIAEEEKSGGRMSCTCCGGEEGKDSHTSQAGIADA
jgi:hypothetical protein